MHNDAFSLFNTKLLFRTTAAQRRDHFAARSARRRLARLLAADCANDASTDTPNDTSVTQYEHEFRVARRD